MDAGRGPLLPALACLAGLLLSLVAFATLPLLGSALGAALSGAAAGLLAREPREAAQAGFLAGAAAVAVLVVLALAGAEVFQGSPILAVPAAVLVLQAGIVGLLPGAAAAITARLAEPRRASQPPPPAPPGPGPP